MKVLMFPGRPAADDNPYLKIVAEGLRARGIEVVDWHKHLSLQRGDIFHVHWPDLIDTIRLRSYQGWRGRLIAANFAATVGRVRRRGGRVVWTVHNLGLHNGTERSTFGAALLDRLISRTDGFIALTAGGIPQILSAYSSLERDRLHVVHHPHYRAVLPAISAPRVVLRERLGLASDRPVLAMIGSLRVNKGALAFLDVLDAPMPQPIHVIMAGSADTIVMSKLKDHPNVIAIPRRLSHQEVRDLHEVADLIVMPGGDYFNSGTVYMALSCDRPLLAASSPTQRDVQNKVGRDWLPLFDGQLRPEHVASAMAGLPRAPQCDLSAFDPAICAYELDQAYRAIIIAPQVSHRSAGNASSRG